jgi:hypothetical protein
MTVAQEISIESILGSKISADGQSIVIGLETKSGEHHISISAELLTVSALTAPKAKTELEERAKKMNNSNKTQAFPCERWEIRKSVEFHRDLTRGFH